MIDDLDATLSEMMRHALPRGLVDQVAISFAPPDATFPPSAVSLPAIDLFLYEIRENRDLRTNERSFEAAADGARIVSPPPLRLDCSYIVTAWPSPSSANAMRDEHYLIGAVTEALLRHPALPRALLQGSLADQPLPPPTAALHPGSLKSVSEFWQALGGKPKVALHYTVTLAVPGGAPAEDGPPVRDAWFRLGTRS